MPEAIRVDRIKENGLARGHENNQADQQRKPKPRLSSRRGRNICARHGFIFGQNLSATPRRQIIGSKYDNTGREIGTRQKTSRATGGPPAVAWAARPCLSLKNLDTTQDVHA